MRLPRLEEFILVPMLRGRGALECSYRIKNIDIIIQYLEKVIAKFRDAHGIRHGRVFVLRIR